MSFSLRLKYFQANIFPPENTDVELMVLVGALLDFEQYCKKKHDKAAAHVHQFAKAFQKCHETRKIFWNHVRKSLVIIREKSPNYFRLNQAS